MSRDLDLSPDSDFGQSSSSTGTRPAYGDLVLRGPCNATAVGFLALLGAMHLTVAIWALSMGRWEAYLSAFLGTMFLCLSIACARFRAEVALLASQRRVRLRNGLKCLYLERSIPFAAVHGVRLTLPPTGARRGEDARIELLCPYEDIECPPTRIPRQQALFLAMMMNVPLIKVSDEAAAEAQGWGEGRKGEHGTAKSAGAIPPAFDESELKAKRRRFE